MVRFFMFFCLELVTAHNLARQLFNVIEQQQSHEANLNSKHSPRALA